MEHGEPASIAAAIVADAKVVVAAVVAAAVAPQLLLLVLQPFVASKKETQPETKLELHLHVEPDAVAL